jgi:hypothetical protein
VLQDPGRVPVSWLGPTYLGQMEAADSRIDQHLGHLVAVAIALCRVVRTLYRQYGSSDVSNLRSHVRDVSNIIDELPSCQGR